MKLRTKEGIIRIEKSGMYYPDFVLTVPPGRTLKITRLTIKTWQIQVVPEHTRRIRGSKAPKRSTGVL